MSDQKPRAPIPFAKGDRIKLIQMGDDPCPIEPGSLGTVSRDAVYFQRAWSVGVKWDNGRTLGLVIPADQAIKVSE